VKHTSALYPHSAQVSFESGAASQEPKDRPSRGPKKARKEKRKADDFFPSRKEYQKIADLTKDSSKDTHTFVARRRNHGDLVFIKAKKASIADAVESLEYEFKLLHGLQHPNIVCAVDFFEDVKGPVLVTGYIRARPLQQVMKTKGMLGSSPFGEEEGSLIASDISYAVAFLANRRIAHRDISPENILLKPPLDVGAETRMEALLIGFAKARKKPLELGSARIDAFSSECRNLDIASDVWSIGTITAAMLSGYPVDEICDMNRIYVVDREALLYSGSPWVKALSEILPSTDATNFVEAACTVSPFQRPAVAQLLDHPFLLKHRSCKNPQGLFAWL
jgi:serine/threonine protein kinase